VHADEELVVAIRSGLAATADAAKAPEMQAYMKSTMPFRGVPTPARTKLMRGILAAWTPRDRPTWEATVRTLWDGAGFREERYAAIDVCAHRSARQWQDTTAVPLYEHLIVTGAWWDHVDAVAIHVVGPILCGDPAGVAPTIRRWAAADDRWLRRSAIIVQNGAKRSTDTQLLTEVIEPNLADSDFFVRKGIGWALREYAKTDPAWVRAFVAQHDLAPLSRREAMKHLS
jgi:3-methyladenine DNA glycosylase AlkD